MNYYDGTKLLSLKDINGNTPEIYICTSNRSAGKTTYFSRLCVNRFLKKGEKFMLVYRFKYELDTCADKFFKDIQSLFFPDCQMSSIKKEKGVYHELYLSEKGGKAVSCGYAIALNCADTIKKMSHLFSDTMRMMFDEFQSETNNYCPREVQKLISIHTSVARGQGKQVRYVPIYMVSNPVSIINPYYVAMKISHRLNTDTKFLKGNGFVLEQGYLESASVAQKSSGFNQAFEDNSYMKYNTDAVYLNDNFAFVEQPQGKGRYILTIKYEGKLYSIVEYPEQGIVFCNNSADQTFPYKIAVTNSDHQVNYLILRKNDLFLDTLRYYFEKGCFRFKNLECKEAVMVMLGSK